MKIDWSKVFKEYEEDMKNGYTEQQEEGVDEDGEDNDPRKFDADDFTENYDKSKSWWQNIELAKQRYQKKHPEE